MKIVKLSEKELNDLKDWLNFCKETTEDCLREEMYVNAANELKEVERLISVVNAAEDIQEVEAECEDYDCSAETFIDIELNTSFDNREDISVHVSLKDLEETVLTGAITEAEKVIVMNYVIGPEQALGMLFNYWDNWAENNHGAYWNMRARELWDDYQRCKKDKPEMTIFDYIHEFEHQEGQLNPSHKMDFIRRYWKSLSE